LQGLVNIKKEQLSGKSSKEMDTKNFQKKKATRSQMLPEVSGFNPVGVLPRRQDLNPRSLISQARCHDVRAMATLKCNW